MVIRFRINFSRKLIKLVNINGLHLAIRKIKH